MARKLPPDSPHSPAQNLQPHEGTAKPLPRFALPEVVGVAMPKAEVAAIVQQSIEEMAEGLDCTRLVALSYAPREGLFLGVTTVGFREEAIRDFKIRVSDLPLVERTLRTRQIMVAASSECGPLLQKWFSGQVVIAPLALGQRGLAVLVGQLKPGAATGSPAWRARAEEVAARAALVVELERVASAYQDELRLRESYRRITSAILEGSPRQEIADLITHIVSERLSVDRIGLYLVSPQGDCQPASLRNVSEEYGRSMARLGSTAPMMARARAAPVPIYTRSVQNDQNLDPSVRDLFVRENIRSVMLAKLQQNDGELRGALVVYPADDRVFMPAEIALFQSFADMAMVAVALSEHLDQQRTLAMMEERNRLAREIHDTVAQMLAALTMQIDTIRTNVARQDFEGLEEMLTEVHAGVKSTLQDTRRAIQGLTPTAVENRTVAEAISREARQFESDAALPVRFVVTGEELPLDPDQRTALLRIAQEALTNIRKHAEPSRVRIGLQFGEKEVALLIEDDGRGFEPAPSSVPDETGGYGLFGMNERARLLGGDLEIESVPGWGTRIIARLPVRLASAQPAEEPAGNVRPPPLAVHEPETHYPQSAPGLPAPDEGMPRPLRVLVVDDHAVTRQGIRAMLELSEDLRVVGEAVDGAQAAEMARLLQPDVVLMDIQMPGTDGIEGMRRIQIEQPQLPVVMLTTFEDEASVVDSLAAGARGYLLKDMNPAELIAAVRAASRGESLFAPRITDRLATIAGSQTDRPPAGLSEREAEILQLLAEGARNKEIAARLFISQGTVEDHLTRLFAKLGVSNRTEAVRAALERGLVRSGARSVK